jgi:catechol 2,3-dioxygenase-like lactoylglutathione lyase family enzyme
MSRVQLALNVSNLDEAITFYSSLFSCAPAKVRPGYANFAIEEPPLKLVLIEGVGEPGSLNHLGIEVATTDEVLAATAHLNEEGCTISVEQATTCCYAVQDKVWVDDPDGAHWEVYTVLADADGVADDGLTGDGRCCNSESTEAAISSGTDAPAVCC